MLKLLRADLYRLLHGKFVYIILGIAAVLSFGSAGLWALSLRLGGETQANAFELFTDTFPLLFLVPCLASSLLIGGDFSRGGLRNKLIVGAGRTKIYLSSALVVFAVSFAVYLIDWLGCYLAGAAGLGYGPSAERHILLFLCGGALVLSYTAIFSTIHYAMKNAASGIAVCIVFWLVSLLFVSFVAMVQNSKGGIADSFPPFVDRLLCGIRMFFPAGVTSFLQKGTSYGACLAFSLVFTLCAGGAGTALIGRADIK